MLAGLGSFPLGTTKCVTSVGISQTNLANHRFRSLTESLNPVRNSCFSLRRSPHFPMERPITFSRPQPFPEEWIMRGGIHEREGTPVTDDAELNHAANLFGGWERHFTSLDICFDNYKMKA